MMRTCIALTLAGQSMTLLAACYFIKSYPKLVQGLRGKGRAAICRTKGDAICGRDIRCRTGF